MKAQFIRGALAFALLISVAGVPQSGVTRPPTATIES